MMMMEERSVLSLPQLTLNQLSQYLEIPNVRSKDWKGLAGVVGFNSRHTSYIEALQCTISKTCLLLREWDRSGQSSINKLVLACYYLDRIDCIRLLEQTLPDLKYGELKERAAVMKRNESELRKIFPLFSDSYTVCHDFHSSPWPAVDQPLIPPQIQTRNGVQREGMMSAVPAHSPDEEGPSISANPSQALGASPAKDKVFISYFPDSSSRSWVAKIAGELERVESLTTVNYANERQMMDVEFKTTAISSSDNVVVFLTPRYVKEYEKLDQDQSMYSHIKIDRKMIQDLFFNEQRRLILVALDDDKHCKCVPELYRGLRLYRYPSQRDEFIHCVVDVPKFVAPPPVQKYSVEPMKICFTADVREFNARSLSISFNPQSLPIKSPPSLHQNHQARRITPAQFPGTKKSFFGKMFNKKR